jgi:tetratricopeptide (TPR) repeat protein
MEQKHFDRAWELGQESALVLGVAAGKVKREGDIEAAIQLQRRAATLDPLGFVNNSNLASLLFYGGHFDEARQGWLKAADLNPEYTDELNWLIGLSWIMQEQYKEAETSFLQVPPGAERDQGMALIHYARGEQSEYDAAVQRLSARTDFNSAYYLTKIFSFHGEMDKSFQWLAETTDRILESDPRQRDGRMLNNFEQCPLLAPMRRDPRWVGWLARIEDKIAINRI